MQYLENLITEIKKSNSKKVSLDKVLLFRQYIDDVEKDKQQFVESMLALCSCNKDIVSNIKCYVMIGKIIDKSSFSSLLYSNIRKPEVRVRKLGSTTSELAIYDGANFATAFVLTDIQIKHLNIWEYADHTISYTFGLHSKRNNIDYSVTIEYKQEVE